MLTKTCINHGNKIHANAEDILARRTRVLSRPCSCLEAPKIWEGSELSRLDET